MNTFTKRFFSVILAFSLLAFTACSDKGVSSSSSQSKLKTITVGATPAPHAEILNACKDILKEKGYELKIVEFGEYALINPALSDGDLDANFFQHTPYLNDYCEKQNADLTALIKVHFEPLGIYGGKSTSLEIISDGCEIAVPNDSTNEARSLKLLEDNGLIKLKTGAGLSATINDITENPHNINFIEMAAAQIPRILSDVDFAIINGNYALDADISDKLIITENPDSDAAQEFANVIAVKSENAQDPAILALKDAITSQEVRVFIETQYNQTVIPVF